MSETRERKNRKKMGNKKNNRKKCQQLILRVLQSANVQNRTLPFKQTSNAVKTHIGRSHAGLLRCATLLVGLLSAICDGNNDVKRADGGHT